MRLVQLPQPKFDVLFLLDNETEFICLTEEYR